MTVEEMIRQLRIDLGDQVEPFRYSNDYLKSILDAEYLAIQLSSDYWDFLHTSGAFITTVADTDDYAVAAVRKIDADSVYYIKTGTTARGPVMEDTYQNWQSRERTGDRVTGPPQFIIQLPDQSWKVDPTPDAEYVLYADRYLRPAAFANAAAEPLWESEYHRLVLLEAKRVLARLRPDDPRSAVMLAQAEKQLPGLRRTFNSRYLPQMGNAEPMI